MPAQDSDATLEFVSHHESDPQQFESAVDEELIAEIAASTGCSRDDAQVAAQITRDHYGIKSTPQAHDFKDAVAFILASPNPVNAAWGVAIASGFDVCEGRSIENISSELTKRGLPVTKAGLSKAAYEFAELLNLPKSRYQRSDSAQEAYADRATKTHEAKALATKPRSLPKSVSDADLSDLNRLGVVCDSVSIKFPQGVEEHTLRSVWAVLGKCNKAMQWWIGDTARATKQAKGMTWEQYAAEVGLDPETARKYAQVAEYVPCGMRIPQLDFAHHQLVAPLLPDQQRHWLEQSLQHGLTVRELRDSIKAGKVCKFPQHLDMGIDSIESWTGALMHRWERNVFKRMLPVAPKPKLQAWLARLERPHAMYEAIKRRLERA